MTHITVRSYWKNENDEARPVEVEMKFDDIEEFEETFGLMPEDYDDDDGGGPVDDVLRVRRAYDDGYVAGYRDCDEGYPPVIVGVDDDDDNEGNCAECNF